MCRILPCVQKKLSLDVIGRFGQVTFGIVIRTRVAETAQMVVTNLSGKEKTYRVKIKPFDSEVGKIELYDTCQSNSSYAVN